MATTLQDLIDAGEHAPFASRIEERGGVPMFHCRCGRWVRAEMMADLLPPGAPGLIGGPQGADRYRCDGCWRRWLMTGEVEEPAFRAALGLPPRKARVG